MHFKLSIISISNALKIHKFFFFFFSQRESRTCQTLGSMVANWFNQNSPVGLWTLSANVTG